MTKKQKTKYKKELKDLVKRSASLKWDLYREKDLVMFCKADKAHSCLDEVLSLLNTY